MDTPGLILVRRTKRLWTDEEKRSICFQTAAPGVSVAQVARRNAVNANMVFKWLRDPRYAPAHEVIPADVPSFLPVEIVDQHRNTLMPPVPEAAPSANHIEIELAGGLRMRISGSYDPEVLARLIRGLTARSQFRRTHGSGWRRASPTCERALRRSRRRPKWC